MNHLPPPLRRRGAVCLGPVSGIGRICCASFTSWRDSRHFRNVSTGQHRPQTMLQQQVKHGNNTRQKPSICLAQVDQHVGQMCFAFYLQPSAKSMTLQSSAHILPGQRLPIPIHNPLTYPKAVQTRRLQRSHGQIACFPHPPIPSQSACGTWYPARHGAGEGWASGACNALRRSPNA